MRGYFRRFKYKYTPPKPYRVMTPDGDYFFATEEEAHTFAVKRYGFVLSPKGTASRST